MSWLSLEDGCESVADRFAEVRRKDDQAVARQRSGMPFQVREISLGWLGENVNVLPAPRLVEEEGEEVEMAIFDHFARRDASSLLWVWEGVSRLSDVGREKFDDEKGGSMEEASATR